MNEKSEKRMLVQYANIVSFILIENVAQVNLDQALGQRAKD
jgi:hypothetical protein